MPRQSIAGPGLGDPSLSVAGQGEMGKGTPLGTLVESGGFFAQMYGQVPDLQHQHRVHEPRTDARSGASRSSLSGSVAMTSSRPSSAQP
jgi:hypothetical protein